MSNVVLWQALSGARSTLGSEQTFLRHRAAKRSTIMRGSMQSALLWMDRAWKMALGSSTLVVHSHQQIVSSHMPMCIFCTTRDLRPCVLQGDTMRCIYLHVPGLAARTRWLGVNHRRQPSSHRGLGWINAMDTMSPILPEDRRTGVNYGLGIAASGGEEALRSLGGDTYQERHER